jgi:hypothetical protein
MIYANSILAQNPTFSHPSWLQFVETIATYQHAPDMLAARALYAAFVAHALQGAQVWLLLLAPPGSSKTTYLDPLADFPTVHSIDNLSPNSFISGHFDPNDRSPKKGRESASLLHRIGENGVILMPDFSTILGNSADKKAEIFSALRRIYDGTFSKEFGTAGDSEDRKWSGRITLLAATTPSVEGKVTGESAMGDRFLLVRWHRPGGIETGLKAMKQDRDQMAKRISKAVRDMFADMPKLQPMVPDAIARSLSALSEFVALARTPVQRDGYSKAITQVPEPEGNTRLAQQLQQLCKGSALLDRRNTVNEHDLELAKRVAFDSIPSLRRALLDDLISGTQNSKLPASTRSYQFEELEVLGVVNSKRQLTLTAQGLLSSFAPGATPMEDAA